MALDGWSDRRSWWWQSSSSPLRFANSRSSRCSPLPVVPWLDSGIWSHEPEGGRHADDPEPARSAPVADLRTDVPGYRIYGNGELAEQRSDIKEVWRDDLVTFLLGCSFTFEHAWSKPGFPRETSSPAPRSPCSFRTSPAFPRTAFMGRWW